MGISLAELRQHVCLPKELAYQWRDNKTRQELTIVQKNYFYFAFVRTQVIFKRPQRHNTLYLDPCLSEDASLVPSATYSSPGAVPNLCCSNYVSVSSVGARWIGLKSKWANPPSLFLLHTRDSEGSSSWRKPQPRGVTSAADGST